MTHCVERVWRRALTRWWVMCYHHLLAHVASTRKQRAAASTVRFPGRILLLYEVVELRLRRVACIALHGCSGRRHWQRLRSIKLVKCVVSCSHRHASLGIVDVVYHQLLFSLQYRKTTCCLEQNRAPVVIELEQNRPQAMRVLAHLCLYVDICVGGLVNQWILVARATLRRPPGCSPICLSVPSERAIERADGFVYADVSDLGCHTVPAVVCPIVYISSWLRTAVAQRDYYGIPSSVGDCRIVLTVSYAVCSGYLRSCCEQVLFLAASVCLSLRTKSRKPLIRNWCNLLGICPVVNARGVWKLVTFDLESYFRTYLSYNFRTDWPVDLATLTLIWRYDLRISMSRSSFGSDPRLRSPQQETAARRFVLPSDRV